MKRLKIRKYLFDALQACELLVRFSAGKSLENYREDALLRSAIERQFEIVGEALNQAFKVDADLSGRISDLSRIIAFRNRLIHAYSSIADEVVWDVLASYLPRLQVEVQRLLDEDQA